MKKNEEELVLFATSIAMQLACDLSIEEIEQLRCLVGQISCSLTTLIAAKCATAKKEKMGG